jgi:protein-serine/threonine kinase
MIPTQGKGVDAVNFRSLKESESMDISRSRTPNNNENTGDVTDKTEDAPDPFGEFNSGKHPPSRALVLDLICLVTLHYDGDDYHSDELYLREHQRTAIAEA